MRTINLVRPSPVLADAEDPRSVAERHERTGRVDRAIELYRQLAWRGGWMMVKRVGDLLARLNRFESAAQEHARVAEMCAAEGCLRHAVGALKRAQKLNPTAPESYRRLAELYAQLGRWGEAKGQWEVVVGICKSRSDLGGTLDALGKIVEIDPDDLKAQSMRAEFYLQDGQLDKSIEIHIAIATTLRDKGHLIDAGQVLERALRHDSTSGRLRAELARVQLLKKGGDEAAQSAKS
jgi:tetratricopeptide (TPR) repeat protein